MAVTTYRSTDSGAPSLTNADGSLNAVLRACLVDGYGSKAAAGWTAPFTDTNVLVLKQGAGGNGRYLRFVDALVDSYGSRSAKLRAYEAMTDANTGTGPCPTPGQISGDGANMAYFAASHGASPAVWMLVATPCFFHLVVEQRDVAPLWPEYMAFGTFISDLSGDTFNDILIAGSNGGTGFSGYINNASHGPWCMRSDTGVVGAVACSLLSEVRAAAGTMTSVIGIGDAFNPYPDRVRGGLLQSQLTILCDGYRRGRIPGLWETHHPPASLGGHRTTWSGAAGTTLAGKSFQLAGPISSLTYSAGAYVTLETSDTWN